MFDRFSRGRYATDASIYQMMPLAVVSPRTEDDICTAIAVACEHGLPVLARGGGTSQCGQTVNEALVLDNTEYFNDILELDVEGRRCVVRPGIVLDERLVRELVNAGLITTQVDRHTIGLLMRESSQHALAPGKSGLYLFENLIR